MHLRKLPSSLLLAVLASAVLASAASAAPRLRGVISTMPTQLAAPRAPAPPPPGAP